MRRIFKNNLILIGILSIVLVLLLLSIDYTPVVSYAAGEKIMLEGSIGNYEKTYGEADPIFKIFDNTNTELNINVSFNRDKNENVGDYIISINSNKSDPKYDYSKIKPGKLTIKQKPINIVVWDNTKTYGDKDSNFEYSINTNLVKNDQISQIEFIREQGENVRPEGYKVDINKSTLKIMNNNSDVTNNYLITSTTGTLIINKRKLTLESNNINAIYKDDITPSLTTLIPIYNGNIPTINYKKIKADFIGSKKIEFDVKFSKNNIDTTNLMKENLDLTLIFGFLTVSKRLINIIPSSLEIIYGDDCDIRYEINPETPLGIDNSLSGNLSREKATSHQIGKYLITKGDLKVVNGNEDLSNYYDIIITNAYVEIKPKEINVEFDNLSSIYGEKEQDLTKYNEIIRKQFCYSEFQDFEFIRENFHNKNVGIYEIIPGYNLSDNYKLLLINNKYTITKRNIKVKPLTLKKEYGTLDPIIGFEIISGSIVDKDFLDIKFNRAPGNNIGDYDVTLQTTKFDNYNVEADTYTFTISPKNLYIKGIIISNKIFDGNNHANLFFTADYKLEGVIPGDDVELIKDGSEKSIKANFIDEKIGTNKEIVFSNINLTGLNKDNYTLVAPNITANITPKEIIGENVSVISINGTVIDEGTIVNSSLECAENSKGIGKSGIKLYPIIIARYNIELTRNNIKQYPNGYLQYKIEIPDNFKKIYGLKVCVNTIDGEKVLIDSVQENNDLIFNTDLDIVSIEIVNEDTEPLIISAIVFSSLAGICLIVIIILLIVKKVKHKTSNK